MEIKDFSEIHYASYNPRTLSDYMGKSLDASINTFGDISGLTSNERTNTWITGHQRLRLLDERYPGRVKIHIEHRFDTPDEFGTVATGYVGVEGTNLRLNYRAVDWDIGKEKAANISANKVSATFDDDLLAQLDYDLSQMENGDELLALTGQTEKEIDKLLQSVGVGPEIEQPAEDEPEAEEKSGKLTFALSKDQRELVDRVLSRAKSDYAIPHTNLDNINGTALYYICQYYEENHTSHDIAQTPTQTIQPPAAEAPTYEAPASQTTNPATYPTYDLTSIPN